MGFDLSATAQCDFCGKYLSSNDAECKEHSQEDVSMHVFRRFRTSLTVRVLATRQYKWQKLADSIGEDWIAWQYLGDRSYFLSQLQQHTISDIPRQAMSTDARNVSVE